MKISVFPKAKALPSSGEEKAKEAKYTSKPHLPEVKDFQTEDELIDIITNFCWSPFVFEGFRRESNFIATDLLVFDIDEGQTIEEAEKIVQDLGLTCLALPTTSHTEEHHKFRIIFPLSKTITNSEEYTDTYAKYAEYFTTDPACKDVARMYFGSTLDDGFFHEGELLKPIHNKVKKSSRNLHSHRDIIPVAENIEEIVEQLYGEKREKIPKQVSYFLENAPDNLGGEWYSVSNSFLFTLGLQNVPYENITNIFYQLYPFEVDKKVKKTVDSIIEDGYNSREDTTENVVKERKRYRRNK